MATRRAVPDPALRATVVSRMPLRYAAGADPALDRPAHVRAASGLAWVGGRLVVAQDDANFLARVDPATGVAEALTLPAGAGGLRQFDDGRGNKRDKLDLEACVAVEAEGRSLLLAFGSGSTARRESVLVVEGWEGGAPAPSLVHAPRLYDALRRAAAFAGTELNVEGAAQAGERLLLVGRGNGAPRGEERAVNAICALELSSLLAHLRAPGRAPPPAPRDIVRYDLGAVDGVPLGFTDAAAWGDSLVYSAAAEDSPNAVDDGRVAGCALGVIDAGGRARWAPLRDGDGAPFLAKVEGIAPFGDGSPRLYAAVDRDDPAAPSELCVVALGGPWA